MNSEQKMNVADIVRAWKDETYAESLSTEQRNALPQNPAGELELTDTEADLVVGGCALDTSLCIAVDSIETTCHCPLRIKPVLTAKRQFSDLG